MAKKYEADSESPSISHPSEDTTSRFPMDQLLRRHGFTIHSRKNDTHPLWRRNGKIYTERKALSLIPKWEREEAQYVEEIGPDIDSFNAGIG